MSQTLSQDMEVVISDRHEVVLICLEDTCDCELIAQVGTDRAVYKLSDGREIDVSPIHFDEVPSVGDIVPVTVALGVQTRLPPSLIWRKEKL